MGEQCEQRHWGIYATVSLCTSVCLASGKEESQLSFAVYICSFIWEHSEIQAMITAMLLKAF